MIRLLFVCSGNTCRSPMAQGLLQEKIRARGLEATVTAGSAGVAAWPGQPASAEAMEVMKRRGLSLASHRSRQITAELLAAADLVLTMTVSHKENLLRLFPAGRDKIFALGEFSGSGLDVADPYGQGLREYQSCAGQIETMLEPVLDKIGKQKGNLAGKII